MTKVIVNKSRIDPYKNYKFLLKWDGRYVAGVSKVSALKKSVEVASFREGNTATEHKLPGRTNYDAITLERGITHDAAFEQWANKVWNLGTGIASAELRKDIILEQYNEAGQLEITYKIYHCSISEYQAMIDLDANANAVVIQHIKLEHEGLERITK